MDDRFKTVMLCATLGGFVVAIPMVPFGDCGPRQICAIVPGDQPHTHEREPGLMQAFQQITAVSTASSAGTYFTVMPE